MKAPVVEDVGDMAYLFRLELFTDPKGQIPVLSPFKSRAHASRTLKERASDDQEMGEVILAQEEQRIPGRLEIGTRPHPGWIDLVLVAIEKAQIRLVGNGQGHHGQG